MKIKTYVKPLGFLFVLLANVVVSAAPPDFVEIIENIMAGRP